MFARSGLPPGFLGLGAEAARYSAQWWNDFARSHVRLTRDILERETGQDLSPILLDPNDETKGLLRSWHRRATQEIPGLALAGLLYDPEPRTGDYRNSGSFMSPVGFVAPGTTVAYAPALTTTAPPPPADLAPPVPPPVVTRYPSPIPDWESPAVAAISAVCRTLGAPWIVAGVHGRFYCYNPQTKQYRDATGELVDLPAVFAPPDDVDDDDDDGPPGFTDSQGNPIPSDVFAPKDSPAGDDDTGADLLTPPAGGGAAGGAVLALAALGMLFVVSRKARH